SSGNTRGPKRPFLSSWRKERTNAFRFSLLHRNANLGWFNFERVPLRCGKTVLTSAPSAIFFDLDDTLLDQERSQRIGALRLREEHQLTHLPEAIFLERWNALLHEHIAPYFA